MRFSWSFGTYYYNSCIFAEAEDIQMWEARDCAVRYRNRYDEEVQ